jgi:acyl phosphate:glycerol-3-phosphate acyltransferase
MSPLAVRILFAAGAYLLGSFPTGYLFFRRSERRDIRGFGSGATGATNVLRLKGWRLALPVALIDMAKGFLPAVLAARFFPGPAFPALCASLAVIGHCFPLYIGFQGGKGVATAAGAMLALAPLQAAGALWVFVMAVGLTRYVSLGSILAAVSFPILLALTRAHERFVLATLPIVIVILIRHSANIGRLVRGTENRLGRKAGAAP